MPDVNLRLVRKGRDEPLRGLAQQARVSVELAKMHAGPLEDAGWTPGDTVSLANNLDQLETDAAAQAEAMASSVALTRKEASARAGAKKFVRRLRNALPRALRENPDLGVSAEVFESGPLRDSTPKILAYLARIRPHVVRLDEALKRYFGGATASMILDEVSTALETADAVQEATVEQLPVEWQKLHELKGLVLEQIEDLNRAGRSAFDGNAVVAAQFNKDILLRARQKKRTRETVDADGSDEQENEA
jgi:hypothetical protein